MIHIARALSSIIGDVLGGLDEILLAASDELRRLAPQAASLAREGHARLVDQGDAGRNHVMGAGGRRKVPTMRVCWASAALLLPTAVVHADGVNPDEPGSPGGVAQVRSAVVDLDPEEAPPGAGRRWASGAHARGLQHLASGDYQAAYEELLEALADDPSDPDVAYALGRSAYEIGNYETAVAAFERVLMARPGLRRAKLELARTYLALGHNEVARRFLEQVRATGPPVTVRRNIEAYLREIEEPTNRHSFSGSVTVGYGWDSNVFANCDRREVVTRSGGTIECPNVRDTAVIAMLTLDHSYDLLPEEGVQWRTLLRNSNYYYDDVSSEDLSYVSLQTGPVIHLSDWLVQAQVLGTYLEEGRSQSMKSVGGVLGAATELNDSTVLLMSVRGEERTFYQEPDETGFSLSGQVGPAFTWGKNRVVGQVGAAHHNARTRMESYGGLSASVLYERDLPNQTTLLAGCKVDYFDYDGPDDRFGKTRRDHINTLSLGLSKQLRPNLSLEVGYTYQRSSSSLQIYDYDRHRPSVALKLSF